MPLPAPPRLTRLTALRLLSPSSRGSFHLDHIASLPYVTEKTSFKGRVFMTHATKAIGLLLIKDYIRVR